MDKLGIGILRELLVDESTLALQANIRKPYRAIARRLRVTEDTVRNRVQRMHDIGLIRRWRLGFNPTLLGLQMEYISADVNPPSNKEDVIRWARAIPRVLGIQSYADRSVGIEMAYAEREELDQTIIELKRKANSHKVFATKTPFLPCRMRLTDMDWLIVREIQNDPRKPYGQVAESLGVSRRTVKRRAERMVKGHAFWLLPELGLRNLYGAYANLSVTYPPGLKSEVDRKILQRYGALMIMGHSTLPEYSWFGFVVPNPGVAKEIQAWTSGLKGVTTAEVMTTEEIVYPAGDAFDRDLSKALPVLVKS